MQILKRDIVKDQTTSPCTNWHDKKGSLILSNIRGIILIRNWLPGVIITQESNTNTNNSYTVFDKIQNPLYACQQRDQKKLFLNKKHIIFHVYVYF